MTEPPPELGVCPPQRRLWIDLQMPRKIGHRKQQIANLVLQLVAVYWRSGELGLHLWTLPQPHLDALRTGPWRT